MIIKRNAAPLLLALMAGVQFGFPALAVRTHPGLGATTEGAAEATPGFVTIGHISANSELLAVLAEDANVKIRRSSTATDIIVLTNQPRDWNISGSTIRQAAMLNSHGVAMLADKLGSRCIANGKIYPLPPGPIQGGISLNKDGVMVGGKKLEPIPGSEVPGIGAGDTEPNTTEAPGKLKGRIVLPDTGTTGATSGNEAGGDRLEVIVPESFGGSLKIGAASNSEVELSGWNGGSFEAYMIGKGSMTAGKLDALSKAIVDVSGTGTADIKDLSAKSLVANVNGTGKINVAHGSAGISNATISGQGSITLKGDYKNLKQAVQGQGTISVSN